MPMQHKHLEQQRNAYKLTFSSIKCKIAVSKNEYYGLVARMGKSSSKYTQIKQCQNGYLKFEEILELPLDRAFVESKNSDIKQKCEIMLYKFKWVQNMQNKELIGMASLNVSSITFENQEKKVRLTNSFDKQAFVKCIVKIEIGKAENVDQQNFGISSTFQNSDTQPYMQDTDSVISTEKPTNISNFNLSKNFNHIISSHNKRKASEHGNSKRIANIDREARAHLLRMFSNNTRKNNNYNDNDFSNFQEYYFEDQNSFNLISNLQQQINQLSNKLRNSEREIFRIKSKTTINDEECKQDDSQKNKSKVNKEQQNKNLAKQHKTSNFSRSLKSQQTQKQHKPFKNYESLELQTPPILENRVQAEQYSSELSEKQQANNNSVINCLRNSKGELRNNQNAPTRDNFCSQSNLGQSGQVNQSIHSQSQISVPFTAVFGRKKLFSKLNLQEKTIEFKYEPLIRKSNQSMSYSQAGSKQHSRSYVKFNKSPQSKRFGSNHKAIGSIKDEGSQSQSNSFIGSQLNIKSIDQSNGTTPILNLLQNLGRPDYHFKSKSNSQVSKRQSIAIDSLLIRRLNLETNGGQNRVTLQMLNNKVQNFRKRENKLRISNQKLKMDNLNLAQENEILKKEVRYKTFENSQQYKKNQKYTQQLSIKIAQMKKQVIDKDNKIEELNKKYEACLNQSNNLKAKMKEQHKKISQYRKLLYEGDQSKKQKQQRIFKVFEKKSVAQSTNEQSSPFIKRQQSLKEKNQASPDSAVSIASQVNNRFRQYQKKALKSNIPLPPSTQRPSRKGSAHSSTTGFFNKNLPRPLSNNSQYSQQKQQQSQDLNAKTFNSPFKQQHKRTISDYQQSAQFDQPSFRGKKNVKFQIMPIPSSKPL